MIRALSAVFKSHLFLMPLVTIKNAFAARTRFRCRCAAHETTSCHCEGFEVKVANEDISISGGAIIADGDLGWRVAQAERRLSTGRLMHPPHIVPNTF